MGKLFFLPLSVGVFQGFQTLYRTGQCRIGQWCSRL